MMRACFSVIHRAVAILLRLTIWCMKCWRLSRILSWSRQHLHSIYKEIKLSKPEIITIDDVKYIRADSVDDTKKFEGDIKIIIADRGFVYIGNTEETDDYVRLTNASNIRTWGTTKGIGELVNGPLSGTKLDKVGSLRIPNRAVISIIDVEQAKWKLL